MGILYVVGTPIGNLEDLTRRAARVLGEVDLIAAEDTRVTRRLLNHLGLKARLTSCHQHNWPDKLPTILQALESGDVALVTDAGMPAVSDPGSELVSQVAAAGFRVEIVPGVSAVTSALAVAGIPADSFLFIGFLPRRRNERDRRLAEASRSPHTLVIFEAPHRLTATLNDLLQALGDREVAVCRELTKRYEEVFRGVLSQAKEKFPTPRGEFVLVVRGAGAADADEAREAGPEAVLQELLALRQSGARAREAVAAVAASSGWPRRRVYQLWLTTAQD